MPTITKELHLRGAALEVMHRREKEVLVAGPAGTGKSYSCLSKVHLMALQNPGSKYLLVRKTHVSLTATGLVTFKEHVANEAIGLGIVRWYGGSGSTPPGFHYENGSVINVGGMDNPTKIMSSEYDLIYVQEATEFTADDWEKCTTRLRNGVVSFQQLLADCNPEGPDHWLKKRCDAGQTVMLYGLHTDNPKLFDALGTPTEKGTAYLELLAGLTGVRRHRLFGGIWAAAEGVIYEGWNPAVHLVPRFVPPRDWTRIWAVDFGFVHPFVWQEWVVDPDGRMILYREIYHTKRLVEDHARQIRALKGLGPIERDDHGRYRVMPYTGPPVAEHDRVLPRALLADHDAEDRATLERHVGFGTIAANKTVSEGIQATASRLKLDGTGRPRLMIMQDARVELDRDQADARKPTCTAEEVGGYVWLEGRLKEQPLKEQDDGMDTMRYAVAEMDLHGKTRVRWG